MSSIIKVDTVQDQDGNNIINENANTVTVGKSGDTVNIVGTLTGFESTGIDDNATSTAITINSSENIGIGTASPSQKLDVVGSIEVSDGIYIDGTAAANKLDDYEEGTWTPSWSFETSGSAVSSAYFGNYTKIGRIVHVSGGLLTSSISSPTGNAIIVTLPFQATTESSRDFAGSLTQVRRFASNMPDLRIEVSGGTSSLRFYDNATSANNFAQLQGSDFETAASQNIVFFNVTYETD